MTPPLLLALAQQATVEADALQVLGDYIQDTAWFDPRVLQIMWPLGKCPRNGFRSSLQKQRRRIDRENFTAGFPVFFRAFASRPNYGFARAIVAVCLFGGWKKRPWGLVAKTPRAPAVLTDAFDVRFTTFRDVSIRRAS